jgi:hypothetical protein
MRMAADQLRGDRLDYAAEIELLRLLRHPGVKHDLQQEIAKLVAQVGKIATLDGVRNLIGLFDGVRGNGGEVLLQIPRTTRTRRAERRHDLDQAGDVAGGSHQGASVA